MDTGLNADGGNIGVPAIQLVGLLVVATAGNRQPYWVCAVYLVALAVAVSARRCRPRVAPDLART